MIEPAHVRSAALIALGVDPLLQRRVGQRHHPALAGGELLVGVETEHRRVPAPADGPPVGVHRAECLAGVLDEPQVMALRKRLEGGHRGGVAEDVHRQQRARVLGDRGSRGLRVEVERDGIDVGEDRPRALIQRDVGGGHEREGARDHLVAAPHPHGAQREVQARRAAGDRARQRRAHARGERPLELAHARTEREVAGAQHLHDGPLLGLPQDGPGERDLLAHARRAPAAPAATYMP